MPTAEPAIRRCRIPAEARLRGARTGARAAARQRREEALMDDDDVWPLILLYRAEGQSLQSIADTLTRDGWETRQGRRRWHAAQVQRIIQRVLDDAPRIVEDLEEDLQSLRTVYRRERGKDIAALPEEDDDGDDDEDRSQATREN